MALTDTNLDVMKLYNTKANALANGTAGRFSPDNGSNTPNIGLSGHGGLIYNAEGGAATSGDNAGPFYIYQKFYARLEANEPVSEFHIDWDDGEDNSPEKANIEIIKCDPPAFSAVTEHIYTEHKHFFPLIRVKSVDGYLSKWYTNDSSLNSSLSELEDATVAAGQNEFSIISKDKAGSDRIPHIIPFNLPPVGVLKTDRKRVYSGIDNHPIEALYTASVTAYPVLYAYIDTDAASGAQAVTTPMPNIRFTFQDNMHQTDITAGKKMGRAVRTEDLANFTTNHILTDSDPAPEDATTTTYSDGDSASTLATCMIPLGNYSGTPTKTSAIKKLLRVELLSCKYDTTKSLLSDSSRIYIKVFDPTTALTADPDPDTDLTVAILSNGNPIVELDDPSTIATLDGTESYTRASNVSINTYRLDDDKLESTLQTAVQATKALEVGDELRSTFNISSTGVTERRWTHSSTSMMFDSDFRMLPERRLCRLQVHDDRAGAVIDVAHLNMSRIESFDASAVDYASSGYSALNMDMPASLDHRELLLFGQYTDSDRDDITWYNQQAMNYDQTESIMNSAGDALHSMVAGASGAHPLNFLLTVRTEQWDRMHFRMSHDYRGGFSVVEPTTDITAYYNNGTTWAPLEIIDETNGLKVSGSIKWKKPNDWTAGNYLNIDGGDWLGPVHEDETGTTNADSPKDNWTSAKFPDGAYAILLGINIYGGTFSKLSWDNLWPYSNSHSQSIEIVDPHHVSLNDIAVAQSISFGRSSRFVSIEDKFGKADVRKIGAAGGKITFGGIDLGGSADDRKTLVGYQKNGTPTFLDVEHKSGEYTRFFGVITNLTEDYPTGKMNPKWAVTMQINHILELGSKGEIQSEKISIGGALIDDAKYIL